MRTTLTLDEQLAKDLQEYAHQNRLSFKDTVNQALSLGLKVMEQPVQPAPYKLKPSSMGRLHSGNNLNKALDLADLLENEAIVAKLEMRK